MARWSERLGPWDSLEDEDLMEAPIMAPGKRPLHHGTRAPTGGASPGKLTLTQRLPAAVIARDDTGPAPVRLPDALRSALGSESGAPLPDAGSWSRRLGADVSTARVVTGARAEAAAQSISARAFTVGDRIFFGAGQSPSSDSLLRHELTHVVQQQDAPMPAVDDLRITLPDEAMEQEAHGAEGAPAQQAASAVIARDEIYVGTAAYIEQHGGRFGEPVVNRLGTRAELLRGRLTTAHVGWGSGGPAAVIGRLTAALTGDTVALLRRLLMPQGLEYWVDRGRIVTRTSGDHVTVGTDRWIDDVCTEIVDGLIRNLGDAIDRVAERYIRARNVAQQRAWEAAGECNPSNSPEAALADIPRSHPIDQYVAEAACEAHAFDVLLDDWRRDHPDLADARSVPGQRTDVTTAIVGNSTELRDDPGRFFVWVRATPADATAEEAAHSLFGAFDEAHRFAVRTPPLFAFNAAMVWSLPQDVQDRLCAGSEALRTERERRTRLDDAEPHLIGFMVPRHFIEDPEGSTPSRDPMAGLPAGLADEAALASSRTRGRAPGAAARGRDVIIGQMGQNKVMLQSIAALGARFEIGEVWGMAGMGHVPAALDTLIERIDQRRARLATAPDADVQQWDEQAAQQAQVLGQAYSALEQLHAESDQLIAAVGGANPAGAGLEGYDGFGEVQRSSRLPLIRTATAYIGAAAASDLPEAARTQLAQASQLYATYPAEMMEGVLQQLQDAIISIRNRDTYGRQGLYERESQLRRRLIELRQALLARSTDAATLMQAIWADIQDLQTEVTMSVTMDGLDQAFTAMGELADSFGVWFDADTRLRNLRTEAATWRGRFATIRDEWIALTNTSDPDGATRRQAIRTRFDALRQDPEFAAFLGRCQDAVDDAQTRAIIARIVAVLAIMVVTMGVGTVVTGVAAGAMGVAAAEATGTAALVITGSTVLAESLTFATLNQAFLANGWDWGEFATEFAFNVVLFSAFAGISRVLRAGRLGEYLADSGRLTAAEMGSQGLTMVIATDLRAQAEARGRELTTEEHAQIVGETTAMFVAGAILGRAARPMLTRLENASGRLGAAIRTANSAREAVASAARALRGTRDLARVREVMRQDAESLRRDIEALEELHRTAREEPQRLREEGFTDEEIAALVEDMPAGILRLRIAEVVQGAEPMGGDNFAVPRDQVPAMLQRAQAAGGEVRTAGQDTVTGDRMYEVEFSNGTRLRIFERAADARPGSTEGAVPTDAEVAAARAEADRVADIMRQRDEALTRLIESAPDPIVVDEVIGGAGQAGTLANSALGRGGGPGSAAPGVEIRAIPSRFNIAPEGSLFSRFGDFAIGQRAGELASSAMTHQPGEYTTRPDRPISAEDYVRALTMTGYETGMVTYRASITRVETNPGDGSWPVDTPVRIEAGGRWIYVRGRFISAMGMGPARPVTFTGADALAAAGRLVYAQDTLSIPGARTVLIIGGGASGAWAAERALLDGARVYWSGRAPSAEARRTNPVPEATRAELRSRGLTDEQIDAFGNAYLGRTSDGAEASPFDRVGGDVTLTTATIDSATLAPNGKVRITTSTGVIEVDGIIAATGQVANLPPGMEAMRFTPVVVEVNGRSRLVGLDPVDARGNPMPSMRLVGAQAMNPAMADHIVPSEVRRFRDLVRAVSSDRAVPEGSRGVPGSIYQTNLSVPYALDPHALPPLPAPGGVPTPDPDRERDYGILY